LGDIVVDEKEMNGRDGKLSRRTIVKGAAWSVPVIAAAAAAPMASASTGCASGSQQISGNGTAGQTVTVQIPACATKVTYTVIGGAGDRSSDLQNGINTRKIPGGGGAVVTGELIGVAGQTLTLIAGGGAGPAVTRPSDNFITMAGGTGYGNGGSAAGIYYVNGAGGAGSAILLGGQPIVVAGGGGGAGSRGTVGTPRSYIATPGAGGNAGQLAEAGESSTVSETEQPGRTATAAGGAGAVGATGGTGGASTSGGTTSVLGGKGGDKGSGAAGGGNGADAKMIQVPNHNNQVSAGAGGGGYAGGGSGAGTSYPSRPDSNLSAAIVGAGGAGSSFVDTTRATGSISTGTPNMDRPSPAGSVVVSWS